MFGKPYKGKKEPTRSYSIEQGKIATVTMPQATMQRRSCRSRRRSAHSGPALVRARSRLMCFAVGRAPPLTSVTSAKAIRRTLLVAPAERPDAANGISSSPSQSKAEMMRAAGSLGRWHVPALRREPEKSRLAQTATCYVRQRWRRFRTQATRSHGRIVAEITTRSTS